MFNNYMYAKTVLMFPYAHMYEHKKREKRERERLLTLGNTDAAVDNHKS